MMLKKLIPQGLKLQYKLFTRKRNDKKKGYDKLFASERNSMDLDVVLSTTQTIRKSYLFENKIHNLKLGSKRIEAVVINPGEILSFWTELANPTEQNGYKKGRNIINGVLSEDFGGGLCQLSGIMYHLALMGGLEITERFNHTVDIYKEEERLSPLGTDATVVYGYKDLRIKNNQNSPIQFTFSVNEDSITCNLKAKKTIKERTIIFDRFDGEKVRVVKLKYKNGDTRIGTSTYKLA
jgi:vancomycin resistance protein VanW